MYLVFSHQKKVFSLSQSVLNTVVLFKRENATYCWKSCHLLIYSLKKTNTQRITNKQVSWFDELFSCFFFRFYNQCHSCFYKSISQLSQKQHMVVHTGGFNRVSSAGCSDSLSSIPFSTQRQSKQRNRVQKRYWYLIKVLKAPESLVQKTHNYQLYEMFCFNLLVSTPTFSLLSVYCHVSVIHTGACKCVFSTRNNISCVIMIDRNCTCLHNIYVIEIVHCLLY